LKLTIALFFFFLFLSLDIVSLITYSFYAAASVDKQLLFWQPTYSV